MEFPLNYLEFTLTLHTAHLGTETTTRTVCGQEFTFPIDLGFTEQEIDRMNRVISAAQFSGPEPEGEGFALYSGGGESLRLRGGLFVGPLPQNSLGVELIVKTLSESDPKIDALMQIATDGNAVLVDGDQACRVRCEVHPAHTSRWPTITQINSNSELLDWLSSCSTRRPVHVPTSIN